MPNYANTLRFILLYFTIQYIYFVQYIQKTICTINNLNILHLTSLYKKTISAQHLQKKSSDAFKFLHPVNKHVQFIFV